jgi:hypothetical protein
MSREVPALPDDVLALSQDILDELCDSEHIRKVHGKRSTYTAGCRGPLCLRADRMYNRDAYAAQRAQAGKPYQPSDLRRDARDDELDDACDVYVKYAKQIEIHVRLRQLYRELDSELAG